MGSNKVCDLVTLFGNIVHHSISNRYVHLHLSDCDTNCIDGLQTLAKMCAAFKLKYDTWLIGENQRITQWIVYRQNLCF